MSRKCSVCNLEEHRLGIDSRIRNAEPLAVLAEEFAVSEDSMKRHAKNHVLRPAKPIAGDLTGQLQNLIGRLEEVYSSACSRGDHKAVIDSLRQISQLTDRLVELQKKDAGSFENLSVPEKLTYMRNDGELFQAWCDYCVAEVDQWAKAAEERERLQRVRELECRSKCLRTEGQVTDSHLLSH